MVMDMYELSLVRNYANWPNCWTRLRTDMPLVNQGEICLVKDVALSVKSVVSHVPHPPTKAPQSSLWEVILGCGNTWMWDNLSFMGDLDWIAASIADILRSSDKWLVYEGDVSIPELCSFCC